MPKLDKRAHERALKLHQKMCQENPEYRKAWDNLLIQMFTDLADAELPEDEDTSTLCRGD